MNLDLARIRQHLKNFDFNKLFIEELGWDRYIAMLEVSVNDQNFTLIAIAQKRGMVAFTCDPLDDGRIPDYPIRRNQSNARKGVLSQRWLVSETSD